MQELIQSLNATAFLMAMIGFAAGYAVHAMFGGLSRLGQKLQANTVKTSAIRAEVRAEIKKIPEAMKEALRENLGTELELMLAQLVENEPDDSDAAPLQQPSFDQVALHNRFGLSITRHLQEQFSVAQEMNREMQEELKTAIVESVDVKVTDYFANRDEANAQLEEILRDAVASAVTEQLQEFTERLETED